MKLSALFLALTIAVCLMATPAAASDGVSGVVQDFFEWSVNAQRETGDAFWRAIYGDSWNPDGGFSDGVGADRTELLEKYGLYTDTMYSEYGSTTLTDTGVRVFPTVEAVYGQYAAITAAPDAANFFMNLQIVLESKGYYSPEFWVRYYTFEAPFDANVTVGSISSVNGISFSGLNAINATGGSVLTVVSKGTSVRLGSSTMSSSSGLIYGDTVQIGSNTRAVYGWCPNEVGVYTATFAHYVDLEPASGLSSVGTLNVTDLSRAGSIAGDVYVVNENGEEVVYNDYSVVNETTNVYNDPISGTERPMEDWAYDYIERQYNITLEDGASVTVKYGDENIEIVEGDSIETLNYGSGSSGEGGGDDGGGSGIGDAIANLFTVLGEIILGLITALINLATKALDALKGLFDLFGQLVETITGFFGGFTDFLAGVFPFLPEETFTIFNFGLILLVAATVFRKFLK